MVFTDMRRRLNLKTVSRKYDVVDVYDVVLKLSSLAATTTLKANEKNRTISRSLVFTTLTVLSLALNLIRLPYISIGVKQLGQLKISETNSTSVGKIENFAIRLIVPISVALVAILTQANTLVSMHKKHPIIIEGLKSIDIYLKYSTSKCRIEMRIVSCFIFCLLICIIVMMVQSILSVRSIANYVVYGYNKYCLFNTMAVECQFHVFCFLVARRFRFLNSKVLEFEQRFLGFNTKKLLSLDAQHLIWNQLFIRRSQASIRTELLILKTTHQKLVEVTQNIGEYFSKPLLLILTSCTMNGFLNVYFAMFGGFKLTVPDQGRPSSDILSQIAWAFYHFLRFITLCVMANVVTEEAKKTKIYVAQTLSFLREETIKRELKSFLNYAVVRKVEFLVCGFFRLDMALITSAIATGSTYLIVLVQFHQK